MSSESNEFPPSDNKLNRRGWLQAASASIAAGAVYAAGQPLFAAGDSVAPTIGELTNAVKGYRKHYVVPANFGEFNDARRRELGVLGPGRPALTCRDKNCRAPGYMAWLEPPKAQKILLEEDVQFVYELTAADVTIVGHRKGAKGLLTVGVTPNDYATKPADETYLDLANLAEAWRSKLARYGKFTVNHDGLQKAQPGRLPLQIQAAIPVPGRVVAPFGHNTPHLRVHFDEEAKIDDAVEFIRQQPQALQMAWGNIHQPLLGGCPGCGLG